MTLAIEGLPGLGEQAEQGLHNKWDTLDSIEFRLTTMGFSPMEKPAFPRPEINPALYQTLSNGDGKAVTYEHARFSAWYTYTENTIARWEGRAKQISNEMKNLQRDLKRRLIQNAQTAADKKPSAELVEQESYQDPRYQQLAVDLQECEQLLEQLRSWSKGFSAGRSLTSRTVEVRRQELESLGGRRPQGIGP
jgi:hypothetical protein